MTRPLPAKIGPNEGGVGHAKPPESFVPHFVFLRHSQKYFLIGRCPYGQPNNKVYVCSMYVCMYACIAFAVVVSFSPCLTSVKGLTPPQSVLSDQVAVSQNK